MRTITNQSFLQNILLESICPSGENTWEKEDAMDIDMKTM